MPARPLLDRSLVFVVGVILQGAAKTGHPVRLIGAGGRYFSYFFLICECARLLLLPPKLPAASGSAEEDRPQLPSKIVGS